MLLDIITEVFGLFGGIILLGLAVVAFGTVLRMGIAIFFNSRWIDF